MVIGSQALHDLWISKAIANREKDIEFCKALCDARIVETAILRGRLETVSELAAELRQVVGQRIDR